MLAKKVKVPIPNMPMKRIASMPVNHFVLFVL
jgi:hypothetical protein